MISVVIPTLNASNELPRTLAALVPAAVGGLVKEVIVSDGGSSDETTTITEAAGARLVAGAKGRGGQLALGAAAARGRWLLFLHADTRLEPKWSEETRALLDDESRICVFTLSFDTKGWAPALVAAGAMLRTRIFGAPYGDQGLLISRKLYDAIGGFADMPLFEDVDLIRRIIRRSGRKSLHVMKARAVTSAARYERDGYLHRVLRNARCLVQFYTGVPPEQIAERYYR